MITLRSGRHVHYAVEEKAPIPEVQVTLTGDRYIINEMLGGEYIASGDHEPKEIQDKPDNLENLLGKSVTLEDEDKEFNCIFFQVNINVTKVEKTEEIIVDNFPAPPYKSHKVIPAEYEIIFVGEVEDFRLIV